MKNFKKGGFGGGFKGGDRGGFKPRFGTGDRAARPMQMHQATCNECGKSCEVPFRPTGERPVYCRDCFSSKGPGASRGGDARPARPSFGSPRTSFGARPEFRPQSSPAPRENDTAIRELKAQMEQVTEKLDRLIDAIATQKQAPKGDSLTKVVKKVTAKKKTKAAKK